MPRSHVPMCPAQACAHAGPNLRAAPRTSGALHVPLNRVWARPPMPRLDTRPVPYIHDALYRKRSAARLTLAHLPDQNVT